MNTEDTTNITTQRTAILATPDTPDTPDTNDDELTRIKTPQNQETLARITKLPTLAQLTEINTNPNPSNTNTFARLDQKIAQQYANNNVLKQRFVLVKTLGSGGMGDVYLAKDLLREEMEDSTPHIAIKVLNAECQNMSGALQALQSEAKKAQALSHPNIVTVYDFDRDGDTAFITMEYIEGQELKAIMRQSKMPHAKAMSIIERVARGLAYAHQQGFVHSDIKPANIFIGSNGAVKILDFGIAKAFTAATMETRSLGDKLTEGALTPAYASLEMLLEGAPHPSDDVYSLACMAYEMLSGRHPFIGADGRPVSADAAQERNLKPQTIPKLPRRYMNALRKGLAFDKSDRFENAGKFIDATKKRHIKRDALLLLAAATATGFIIFSGEQVLEQVVPSVNSLSPALVNVATTIKEGDEFITTGDIDFAHRLYSQAWTLANDLTTNNKSERDKTRAILKDRMSKISNILIKNSKNENMSEFELREVLLALEFMLKDEMADRKKITQAINNINSRLALPSITDDSK